MKTAFETLAPRVSQAQNSPMLLKSQYWKSSPIKNVKLTRMVCGALFRSDQSFRRSPLPQSLVV